MTHDPYGARARHEAFDRELRASGWRDEDTKSSLGFLLGIIAAVAWFPMLGFFGETNFGLWTAGLIGVPIIAFWLACVFCEWRAERISPRPGRGASRE